LSPFRPRSSARFRPAALILTRHHCSDGSVGFGYFGSIVKQLEGGSALGEDSTAAFMVPSGSLSHDGMMEIVGDELGRGGRWQTTGFGEGMQDEIRIVTNLVRHYDAFTFRVWKLLEFVTSKRRSRAVKHAGSVLHIMVVSNEWQPVVDSRTLLACDIFSLCSVFRQPSYNTIIDSIR